MRSSSRGERRFKGVPDEWEIYAASLWDPRPTLRGRWLQTEHSLSAWPPRRSSAGTDPAAQPRPPPEGARYERPRHFAWAYLLRWTFEIDVLACPDCGGRLRLLATIEDPEVIAKILRHLELPEDAPEPAPARALDWLPGVDVGTE